MRARDGFSVTGYTAATTFVDNPLSGGLYGVLTTAGTWGSGGTVTLEIKDVNGVYVPVQTGVTANSYGTVNLPACTVKVVASGTITGGSIMVMRIPGE